MTPIPPPDLTPEESAAEINSLDGAIESRRSNDQMHDLVIEDMRKRKEFGLAKYGTILQAGNGRNALQDAYEEVLDLAVYLRQKIEEERRSDEIISYQVDAFGKEGVVTIAAEEMPPKSIIPDPPKPTGENRCPALGPAGQQCLYRKGHNGRHRGQQLNNARFKK